MTFKSIIYILLGKFLVFAYGSNSSNILKEMEISSDTQVMDCSYVTEHERV